MKYLLLFLTTILYFQANFITAQEFQKNYINYQGVALDASGNAISETAINLQILLRFGSSSEAATYIENHMPTTDPNGLFNIQIGNGNVVVGDYNNLVWGSTAAFISVSLNGAEVGTTELVAVP